MVNEINLKLFTKPIIEPSMFRSIGLEAYPLPGFWAGIVFWIIYPIWGWKIVIIASAGVIAALIAKVYVRFQAVRLWQKWEQRD